MTNQLTLAGESGIELGGIRLGNCALSVPADATAADLEAIGRYLKFSARGSQWHWGDYILAVAARHENLWDAASVAKAWGLDEERLRESVATARFFPPETRRDALSFSHHVEAAVAGTLEKALAALDHAIEKDWGKIELRAHLRTRASEEANPDLVNGDQRDPGPVRNLWVSDLTALDRVAKSKLAEGWTPDADAAAELMKKTKNLRELLSAIEEAAGIEV